MVVNYPSWLARASLVLGIALGAFMPASHAQTYPDKPIRIINPYPPGGSTEFVLRTIKTKFEELIGQPLVIESRPGAGSNIGTVAAAESAPDGYTLLLSTQSLAINPSIYAKVPYDPVNDLTPIAPLVRLSNVLAVHPSLPVNSLKELLDYGRANPGKLRYGSAGNGSSNHMAMELLKSKTGLDFVHVPFKGGSEAVTNLIGGHTQLMFNVAVTLVEPAQAGHVRLLAVTGNKRLPIVALPTMEEAGLAGFDSNPWFALFAPAGTPAAIIEKLSGAVNAALQDPSVAEKLRAQAMEPVGGTPDDLKKLLAEELETWTAVGMASGIRIE